MIDNFKWAVPTNSVDRSAIVNGDKVIHKPKIAYKGFDKDLKCKGEQFQVGETYKKSFNKAPKLCTTDGWHYCNELERVFNHYGNSNGNRYCVIEVTGGFTEDSEKGITTSFKIISEITQESITKMNERKKKERFEKDLGLSLIKDLQIKYPLCSVGGSVALYLHGIRLSRWENYDIGDIDINMPFYHLIEADSNLKIDRSEDNECASGNDFDTSLIINGKCVDIRIDPKQRYEFIEYNGFRYKVALLETIMEAKFRYALNGQSKHKDDCYEICGKTTEKKLKEDINLPF